MGHLNGPMPPQPCPWLADRACPTPYILTIPGTVDNVTQAPSNAALSARCDQTTVLGTKSAEASRGSNAGWYLLYQCNLGNVRSATSQRTDSTFYGICATQAQPSCRSRDCDSSLC
jgi:hypothetical protein